MKFSLFLNVFLFILPTFAFSQEIDNQELSTKRALSAFNAIVANENINRLKNSNNEFLLSVSGYGDKRPLPCFDAKEVCYSKDRRIDLRFIMEIPKK